jgi:hypothetical protein
MNGYIASALLGVTAVTVGLIMIWLTPDDPPSSKQRSRD